MAKYCVNFKSDANWNVLDLKNMNWDIFWRIKSNYDCIKRKCFFRKYSDFVSHKAMAKVQNELWCFLKMLLYEKKADTIFAWNSCSPPCTFWLPYCKCITILSRKLRPIFEICSTHFKYGISSTIRNICSKKLGQIFEMNFDAIKESWRLFPQKFCSPPCTFWFPYDISVRCQSLGHLRHPQKHL